MRHLLLVAVMEVVGLSAACAPSEAALATAMDETRAAEDFKALAQTATRLAGPTNTATHTPTHTITPTHTTTPTSTPTPPPTPTPTLAEGIAYVPDCVGLPLQEATALLNDLGIRWYYVQITRTDLPQWQVFEQDPPAGSLISMEEGKVKLVIALHKIALQPRPKKGFLTGIDCGPLPYTGICHANVLYWCEDGVVAYSDCSTCDGVCGWENSQIGHVCFCP